MFPDSGWSSGAADFPRVKVKTILVHLRRPGKLVATDSSESDIVILVKKDVDRAHKFFFGAYIHGVSVFHDACVEVQKLYFPVKTCQ